VPVRGTRVAETRARIGARPRARPGRGTRGARRGRRRAARARGVGLAGAGARPGRSRPPGQGLAAGAGATAGAGARGRGSPGRGRARGGSPGRGRARGRGQGQAAARARPNVGEGGSPGREGRRGGSPGAGEARRGRLAGAWDWDRRGAQGKKKERGRRERGRGRGGENSPPGIQIPVISTPNPRAPQGERGGRGRGRLLHGRNQMSQKDLGKGGGAWGKGGALGAHGPDRAGLGWAGLDWAGLDHNADQNPRHARPSSGLQSRTENRDGTRRTRNIRQRNALRHDATPMTLRFCLYMTRTPVTILV
jgi:hypothetical protein